MKSEEVVKARLGEYYEHWLPMSNLDLLIPPLDFGVFFCYYNNNDNRCIEKMVGVIKKALGETLVWFYPFCGEVVYNGHGEPEIQCNNRGVNFKHAYADVELKNLDLFRPDVSVHGKLIPDNTTAGKAGPNCIIRPSALQRYVGNVLSVPYSEASVTELRATPLSGIAERVHACLENAARESHFLALIDWVEVHRPEQAIVRVYCKEEGQEAAVVVSSGLQFPVSQVDFGWGAPGFGSYHFPWGGETGYVMPMPSVHCNGDWIVYVHLLKRYLHVLETKAAHVFKPLNHMYLNSSFPASPPVDNIIKQ
nr:shikimate O-hydroxycinnamoyltransferase-like [Ipomoea batatas]